jgi:hypothetical protein
MLGLAASAVLSAATGRLLRSSLTALDVALSCCRCILLQAAMKLLPSACGMHTLCRLGPAAALVVAGMLEWPASAMALDAALQHTLHAC